jgi:hypothetical protein
MLGRAMRSALSGGSVEYAERAVADFQRCGKATCADGLRELADLDLPPSLSAVNVPTLVLRGANGRPNIPRSSEMAATIACAEMRLVPGANKCGTCSSRVRSTRPSRRSSIRQRHRRSEQARRVIGWL